MMYLFLVNLFLTLTGASTCDPGAALYAGETQDYMAPNANTSSSAVLFLFEDGNVESIPLENGHVICPTYPLQKLSLPADTPLGRARILWQDVRGYEAPFCHVVTISSRERRSDVPGEYKIVQTCEAESGSENSATDISQSSNSKASVSTSYIETTLPTSTPGTPASPISSTSSPGVSAPGSWYSSQTPDTTPISTLVHPEATASPSPTTPSLVTSLRGSDARPEISSEKASCTCNCSL